MNKKEQERLTQVEIDTKHIRADIDTIKKNHLSHIESNMGSLDRKIENLMDAIKAMFLNRLLWLQFSLLKTEWSSEPSHKLRIDPWLKIFLILTVGFLTSASGIKHFLGIS